MRYQGKVDVLIIKRTYKRIWNQRLKQISQQIPTTSSIILLVPCHQFPLEAGWELFPFGSSCWPPLFFIWVINELATTEEQSVWLSVLDQSDEINLDHVKVYSQCGVGVEVGMVQLMWPENTHLVLHSIEMNSDDKAPSSLLEIIRFDFC